MPSDEVWEAAPTVYCVPQRDGRALRYLLEGRPFLSLTVPRGVRLHCREGADGIIQSSPMTQQLFVSTEPACEVEAVFILSADALCMRPRRARGEEAILGQVGRPLLHGVNGLYDAARDLLVDWYGTNWSWRSGELEEAPPDPGAATEAGGLCARLAVELSPSPWLVTIRYRYYRDHLGYSYHEPERRRPRTTPVTGWCSWEAFGERVSAGDVARTAEFLRDNFAPYGLRVAQVDDGFQRTPLPPTGDGTLGDSWLLPNEKFPGGHADIAGAVSAAGLVPGLWTGVQITNPAFAARPGTGLRCRSGLPLHRDWIGFVPSCSEGFLDRHVRPLYQALAREGYRHFKVDTLRHLLYEGLFGAVAEGLISITEARASLRRYLESVRDGIGEEGLLLCCWGVVTEAVGIADACRIATDSKDSWGSVLMQIQESARWFHAQRVLFLNDPDVICGYADPGWLRCICSLVSLSGGLFMLSAVPEYYGEEQREVVRASIPAQPVAAAETGPLETGFPAYPAIPSACGTRTSVSLDDALRLAGGGSEMMRVHPFSSLWAVHYRAGGRGWCVVGRFAIVPLSESAIDLDLLGLDSQGSYNAFDFWARRSLGVCQGALRCGALPLGACQVVGLVPSVARPAYLADTRHISFGLGFLAREAWEAGTLILDLEAVAGGRFSCWVSAPEGYRLAKAEGVGLEVAVIQEEPGAFRLDLDFQLGSARLRVWFGTPRAP
jgi:hypothetical protein